MEKIRGRMRASGSRQRSGVVLRPLRGPVVSSAACGIDGSAGGDRAISFVCPDGERYVFVCDVQGHGASASPPANFLAEAVRALVCQGMSPGLIIATLNVGMRHYYGQNATFASAFLAVARRQSITYVSAGHPDAFLFVDARRHTHAAATGPLLGLFGQAEHHERTMFAPPGSTLVVATDGLFDACTSDGSRLEESGLAKVVPASFVHTERDLAAAIVDAVRDRARFTDDYAILTLRM